MRKNKMTPNVKKPGSTPSGKADKKKPVTISLANKSIISCSYNSTPIDVLRTLGKADDRSLIMGIYRGKRIDLRAPLRIDGQLEFCHLKSPEGTEAFRRGITMLISYLIREISEQRALLRIPKPVRWTPAGDCMVKKQDKRICLSGCTL